MKIHEYQGKELLRKYGVPVPRGIVAHSPEEAYHAAKELGGDLVVVKAQIHAGGRGKGGGVKLARGADEAETIARQMLGMKLVTHQTGPEGREVRVLLIEEGLPIDTPSPSPSSRKQSRDAPKATLSATRAEADRQARDDPAARDFAGKDVPRNPPMHTAAVSAETVASDEPARSVLPWRGRQTDWRTNSCRLRHVQSLAWGSERSVRSLTGVLGALSSAGRESAECVSGTL